MRSLKILVVGALASIAGTGLLALGTETTPKGGKVFKFEIGIEDLGVNPIVHEKAVVFLGPEAVRYDSEVDESGTPVSSMIFRRKEKGFLILFHEVEEATVYDLDEFREYTEKNEVLQERLWERLTEGRSPEEAEALKKMRESKKETARLGREAMEAGLSLEKTDEVGELEGRSWRKYQEFRSGTLSREFLVAPWKSLGIQGETIEIFDEIAAFNEKKKELSQGTGRAPEPFEHYAQFAGFPLVVRQLDGEGKVVYQATVISIEEVEEPETLFQNPGYPEEGMADRVRTLE